MLLQADSGDGELKVPSDGTTVAMCHSLLVDPFVICGQDYDSIMWKGGNFGGLCKTLELQTQINKLNAQLQAVISSLQNWTVAPTDGGAALKAFFATQILGKAAGDFSNIENQKIIHGDK